MKYKGKGGIVYNLETSPFAQGGEGKVFNIIGKPNMVAKLYKNGLNDTTKERKLLAMVNKPPSKAVMKQISWPLDVLYDSSNIFVGFVMPKLDINEELNVIYEYGQSSKYPNVPWGNKIIIAKNLCAVLDAIHKAGHVVGDLNPKNISVDPRTGHVVFVDTDSYHIEDCGTVYRCNVGMPYYLPVEIQKKMKGGLSNAPLPTFTQETDNFALALHIFQLLMNGAHPFACRVLPSQKSVVRPEPSDNIINGDFPFFNPKSGTDIPLFSPPFSSLPNEIQGLFKRAFVSGHVDPKKRPNSEEWYVALDQLEKQLKKCGTVSYHEYYNGLSKCPWCEADKRFEQGLQNSAKALGQSTIKKSMAPAYTPAPKKVGYVANVSISSVNKARDNKKLVCYLFLIIASLALFATIMFSVNQWLVFGIGILEVALFYILIRRFNDGDDYSIVFLVVNTLLCATLMVLLILFAEVYLPTFKSFRLAVKNGRHSIKFYSNQVSAFRWYAFVIALILLVTTIIFECVTDSELPAAVAPLAGLIGFIVMLIILNAILGTSKSDFGYTSFWDFLLDFLALLLVTSPGFFVSLIIYLIGVKIGE